MESTLPLYYIASALWFAAAIFTMGTKPEGSAWPYICVFGALVFLFIGRSKRRREEAMGDAGAPWGEPEGVEGEDAVRDGDGDKRGD